MQNDKKTLSPSDNVFVTLSQNGKSIINVYRNNFSSVADIVRLTYQLAKDCIGMAILNVRNQSQGWSCNMPLMFMMPRLGGLKADKNASTHAAINHAAKTAKKAIMPKQCELPFSWS